MATTSFVYTLLGGAQKCLIEDPEKVDARNLLSNVTQMSHVRFFVIYRAVTAASEAAPFFDQKLGIDSFAEFSTNPCRTHNRQVKTIAL